MLGCAVKALGSLGQLVSKAMGVEDPQPLPLIATSRFSPLWKREEHSLWASTILRGKSCTCFINKETEALAVEGHSFDITKLVSLSHD